MARTPFSMMRQPSVPLADTHKNQSQCSLIKKGPRESAAHTKVKVSHFANTKKNITKARISLVKAKKSGLSLTSGISLTNRESRAIKMTFLISVNYFLCYFEIIHYYIQVIFRNENVFNFYQHFFGESTYILLWYYFSLFLAAAVNPLLHIMLNPNVRRRPNTVRASVKHSMRQVSAI